MHATFHDTQVFQAGGAPPALVWVPGPLLKAGGEGAGAHHTAVTVGEFAAQGIKNFEQDHDILLSTYIQSQSRGYRRHKTLLNALPKTPAPVDKSKGPPKSTS